MQYVSSFIICYCCFDSSRICTYDIVAVYVNLDLIIITPVLDLMKYTVVWIYDNDIAVTVVCPVTVGK